MNYTLPEAKKTMADFLISLMYSRSNDEFIGTFFSVVNKSPTYSIPTAAVAHTASGITLLYNPDMFFELNRNEKCFVLLHELCHVLNLHHKRGIEFMKEHNIPKIEFISKYLPFADLPINYSLKYLKAYKTIGDTIFTYESTGLSQSELPLFEDILEYLMNNKLEHEDICKAAGMEDGCNIIYIEDPGNIRQENVGDCEKTIEYSDIDISQVDNIIEDIKDIIETVSKSVGNTPMMVNELLENFKEQTTPQVVSVWEILKKYLVGYRYVNSPRVRSFKRLNRRLRTLPGKIKKTGFSAAFIVDESGSMDDDEINFAFNLVKETCIKDNNDKVHVVHWDTEPCSKVDTVTNLHDAEKITRLKTGGTNFDTMFSNETVLSLDVDLYIIVTDGEVYGWPSQKPGHPAIWIFTTEHGHENWRNDYNVGIPVTTSC